MTTGRINQVAFPPDRSTILALPSPDQRSTSGPCRVASFSIATIDAQRNQSLRKSSPSSTRTSPCTDNFPLAVTNSVQNSDYRDNREIIVSITLTLTFVLNVRFVISQTRMTIDSRNHRSPDGRATFRYSH